MTREPTALRPMFGDPIGEWHQWFAWRPVFTYDRRLVWLRRVLRRCIQKHLWLRGGPEFWWQYAANPTSRTPE